MPATEETTVEASHHGRVDPKALEMLIDKVIAAASHCRESVRHVEARLTLESNPTRARPAIAEATLDIDGTPVRAHVAAPTLTEAVDLLVDRLTRRIDRHESRRHHLPDRHRSGHSGEGEWRHGDLPTERPEYHPLPFDEREIRRRKALDLPPTSIEEALFDLEQLGHDFYLFVEEQSGLDAVVSHAPDPLTPPSEHLEIRAVDPDRIGAVSGIAGLRVIATPPPVLSLAEAREYLDASGLSFLFHQPTAEGRGQVVYRRFDGHDGLVSPA